MSLFRIDLETLELVREGGSFVRTAGGIDEVLQGCVLACRLRRGEVLLDQDAGVRFDEIVFEKGSPQQLIEAEFADQLRLVPGVTRVVSVDYTAGSPITRDATIEINVEGSVAGLAEAIQLSDTVTLRQPGSV